MGKTFPTLRKNPFCNTEVDRHKTSEKIPLHLFIGKYLQLQKY